MSARHLVISLVFSAFVSACLGTTGDGIVTFTADASGPRDAVLGQPLTFDYGHWHVTLTKAELYVGALYLDQSNPTSGAQNTPCILPGTYVGQITSGQTVDLLSPTPSPFPGSGEGTTLPAKTAQIWLTHGDVDAPTDTPVLTVEGTATCTLADVDDVANNCPAVTYPFSASIALGQSNGASSSTSNVICKQRIVTLPAALALADGGTVHLTVDPRALLRGADFDQLQKSGDVYTFASDASDQPSRTLFNGLRSSGGPYAISFTR